MGARVDPEAMIEAIGAHKLRPVVDRVFPFTAAREVYSYFNERSGFGKVAIRNWWDQL